MTDVRLTATTPTGEVVYVLANEKGELRLEEPISFDGNLDKPLICTSSDPSSFAGSIGIGKYPDSLAKLDVDGTIFAGAPGDESELLRLQCERRWGIFQSGTGAAAQLHLRCDSNKTFQLTSLKNNDTDFTTSVCVLGANGYVGVGTSSPTTRLDVDGDVVIGSRGAKWLIRESNGVAMLIEQSRLREGEPLVIEEKVRDLPNELDLVEAALNEVMTRLKMTPPAGWPVWDGSDIYSES